ncbi:MAG: alpha-amylase, partial [Verrucomicrobia bacterium]
MGHPLLYEINTRCWLNALSAQLQQPVTLGSIPESTFADWERRGFTHIWLMGVWTTGPRAREIALHEPGLVMNYDRVLPGWREEDVAGSPYSIAAYEVPAALGGEAGFKTFREQLHERGMKLILDFVPNHLGIDHAWLAERPELFVQSAQETEGTFAQPTADGVRWIANGKDPYFAPWTDVAQVEYRRQSARDAMRELLLDVAARCDGVRCDMAMLLLNEVFTRTWAHLPCAEKMPASEFWAGAITAVKRAQPGFIFMAEVYWGLEGTLQSLGFDYTYDKQLYDDLIWRNYMGAQRRLLESSARFVESSVHFLENHDEDRAATKFSHAELRAAALVILGLPGMRFLHEGQLEGAKLRVPVQLGRWPVEPRDGEVAKIYESLLATLTRSAVGRGEFKLLLPRPAWYGNPTDHNFV